MPASARDLDVPDVSEAVESLLRGIPERWTEFDFNGLTSVEQRALFLLVAALVGCGAAPPADPGEPGPRPRAADEQASPVGSSTAPHRAHVRSPSSAQNASNKGASSVVMSRSGSDTRVIATTGKRYPLGSGSSQNATTFTSCPRSTRKRPRLGT